MEQETAYCKAEGCQSNHTHTTPGHLCPICYEYGHGLYECTDPYKRMLLPKRGGTWKYDTPQNTDIMMPFDKQCTFPRCGYKWSHSTEYHKCSKCYKSHHSSECCIMNSAEWKIYDTHEFNRIQTILTDVNNIYIIYPIDQHYMYLIRKRNDISILKMERLLWGFQGNSHNIPTYIDYIRGMRRMPLQTLTFLPPNIIDSGDDEEFVDFNTIMCPICRTINDKEEIKPIKGSNDKCSVCYENNVELYFQDCEHACVCNECYQKL
jgi:hypothetical protein